MDVTAHTDSPSPRTSLMALLALGLSIMCFIPPFGLVGAILGGLSLRRIARSGGTLTGGAPAKVAIVLGIIVTSGQLYLFFGAVQSWTFYRKQMQPAMARALAAVESGDVSTTPPVFTAAVLAQLTPARLDVVRIALAEHVGVGVEVHIGVQELVESFRSLVRTRSVQPGAAPGGVITTAVPCTIVGDRAEFLAWVFFDADTLQPGNVLVTDVLIRLPNDAALTLLPDGPAHDLAVDWLGWDVLELEKTSP